VLGAEPPLTSVKPEFRHPIDYIFTSKGLAARGVLDVTVGDAPADAMAAREEPWPSDHLALLVEVELPY
jgi:endonuclease/exonuclease/phosphatase family metal-dependent hydrolase